MDNKVIVGVVGYRDPDNRYESIRTVPIYEQRTDETDKHINKTLTEAAGIFLEKFREEFDSEEEG